MEEEIKNLQNKVAKLEKMSKNIIDHRHNGFDSSRIQWSDLSQRRIYIHHTIQGTAAATAANYGVFLIVPVACVIMSFKEGHQTSGNDAGAVTLDLEKLTGTTAPDSGSAVLASTLSLKATANTVQTGTLGTNAVRNLVAGDRLCLKDAGTLTSIANVTVLIELQII